MNRDYRFDIARVLCMTFIVAFCHLYAYIHTEVLAASVIPWCAVVTSACLGLFSFTSGYLLGSKYCFKNRQELWIFYKKRVLRVFPLFIAAAILLYLIGFNNSRSSLNGMLCLSPFIEPRPLTLWYIPVILVCYIITPLVCRKGFRWRFISALIVILIVMALGVLFPSIDWRLTFNMLFYLIGLVSAPYFDWKFKKSPFIKWLTIITFIILCAITQIYEPGKTYIRSFAGFGVFAILFVSEFITDGIFGKGGVMTSVMTNISYASMACYMFHRFFFWFGELIWNPEIQWIKWVYMAGIVFPISIIISYYIQLGYDKLLKIISLNHDHNHS